MVDIPKRYEPIRELGAGGMGRVALVRDLERGQDVALKTYAATGEPADGHFLFKQEFWAMASLRHPHLVAAYDYGELADGTPYFTMEEVPGADLQPPQTEAQVRAWLPGVAAALGVLHAHGWIHGDLKPENVRLGERPRLMDLGLLERAGQAGGPIRGTISYMAPEVIRQGALDARTDLYALGALLYHVLAGRPPFGADHPLALLRKHLQDPPPPLEGVSPVLAAAVQKLLAKEPAARFPSAAALMRALGLAAAEEGAQLLAPPLVGRAAAQVALSDLVEARGAARRVLAGPTGSGKTRLLAALRAEAQLAGVRVFDARGLGVDAAPYEALLPWLRALAAVPGDEGLAPVLVKLLPELPRLWGLDAVTPAPALEGVQERRRLEAAVVALAGAAAPAALWLLDDADALDPASAALVAALQRAGEERPWRWVEAVAASEEQGAIALAPLTSDETLAIARGLLGQPDLPPALAERLPALADGVPGQAEALVAHWVRQGDLHGATGRWEANPAATFSLPGGPDGLSAALDPAARRLAGVAAVLGDEGDLPLLAQLAALPEPDFYAALAALEAADVLHSRSADGRARYQFAKGGGFSVTARRLAAAMPPEEASALHARAAELLARGEGATAPRPLATALAIAHHRLAAGHNAAPWVLAAARRALGLGEVALAAGLLQRALAQAGPDLALQRLLADAWRYEGRTDEAMGLVAGTIVPALREAAAPDLAHELTTLGLLHQLQGRYDEAQSVLEEALTLADVATAVRARTILGRVSYFAGDAVGARDLLARAVADARTAGLQAQLAGALGLYGYLIGATDARRTDEALAVLDEAVAANQAIGDAVEEIEALNLRGNLLLAGDRLAEAESAFAACLAVSQRQGLATEALFAHLNLSAVALDLGQLEAACRHAREAATSAERQGRKFPLSFVKAVEGLARIYLGDVAAGEGLLAQGLALALEIQNRYAELAIRAYTAEALVELGRFKEAEAALVTARELASQTGNDEQQARLARVEQALAARADVASTVAAEDAAGAGRARQLAGLQASIGAGGGLAEVMHRAIAALVALADADRGFLFLYDGTRFTDQVFYGMAEDEADAYSSSLAFKALWSEAPIWVEDAQADAELGGSESVQALALRSVLGVPLLADGEAIGVMLADSQRVNTRFGAQDLDFAEVLAGHVALAVTQARRVEALEREVSELALVATTAEALIGAAALADAFPVVARQALALTGAERALLLAGPELAVAASVGPASAPSLSAARWVREHRQPLHLLDASSDEAFQAAQSIQALGLRTILAVPVGAGEGVLYLDDRRLTDRDDQVLAVLTRLAGLLRPFLKEGAPWVGS